MLANEGAPYRLDEINSCSHGGVEGASNTYASTLWGLDCTHWWAAHHIVGVNYHTIESVSAGLNGKYMLNNYAAFGHLPGGAEIEYRPLSYALAAFSRGAHGKALQVTTDNPQDFNFDAYAYKDNDGSLYVTLINKSYGAKAQPASVAIQLPAGTTPGTWQRLDLAQSDSDIAAMTGITLGGAPIAPQGTWSGQWQPLPVVSGASQSIRVNPTSATILRLMPGTKTP